MILWEERENQGIFCFFGGLVYILDYNAAIPIYFTRCVTAQIKNNIVIRKLEV